jgi:glucose/arabinose dehydrogenase
VFPKWKGDLFAGGLSGVNVDRLRVKVENSVGVLVEREEIMHGMGRVRDVTQGPDGALYVTLNDKDRVVKITPVK